MAFDGDIMITEVANGADRAANDVSKTESGVNRTVLMVLTDLIGTAIAPGTPFYMSKKARHKTRGIWSSYKHTNK